MNTWYYQQAEQEAGPVERGVLDRMKDAGIISNQTLIRRSEEEDWVSVDELLWREEAGPTSGMSENAETAPQPPPYRGGTADYFYLDANHQVVGPPEREALDRLSRSRRIPSNTFVARKGDAGWSLLSAILEMPPGAQPTQGQVTSIPTTPKTATGANRSPIWPWVVCAVSGLCWLISLGLESSIKSEGRPLVNELNRMESGDYQLEAVLESAFRGYEGDPFGKANEEYEKSSQIRDRLAQLGSDYSAAKTSVIIWFCSAIASAGAGFWLGQRFHSSALPIFAVGSAEYWRR